MICFGLNINIALLWLMLGQERTGINLLFGFLLGFAVIAAFPNVLGGQDYRRRVSRTAMFALVFLREFLISNYQLFKAILTQSSERMNPRLIEYNVSDLTLQELLILSQCITLTPGTTSVQISEDKKTLIIHAFNGTPPEEVIEHINQTLRKSLLRATRP